MLRSIANAARAKLESYAAEHAARAGKARLSAATAAAARDRIDAGSYDNAKRKRLNNRKVARSGAAWRHLDPSTRAGLRDNAQDLRRNNSIARALIQRNADLVVGDGPIVIAMSEDEGWNREAERLWNQWWEAQNEEELGHPDIRRQHSGVGLLRLTTSAFMHSGDTLWVDVADEEGRGAIQTVESEQIGNPQGKESADRRGMIGGVECGRMGQPLAYWVREWNEGGLPAAKADRVDAREAVLLVNQSPVPPESGQLRGEAALAAAVDRIDQIDSWIENTGVAAEVATWLGLVWFSDNPVASRADIIAGTAETAPEDATDSTEDEVEFGPGFSYVAKPGQKPEQIKPEFPTAGFGDFLVSNLMIICGEIGLPFPVAFLEYKGLTASNAKSLLSLTWRCKAYEQDYLARAAVGRAYRRKIAEWIRTGRLSFRDDWREHLVAMPPTPVQDFGQEVDAWGRAVDRNFATDDMAVRALGTGRSEVIMTTRARERARAVQLGIAPPELPGAKRPGDPPPTTPPTPEPAPEPAPEPDEDDGQSA